MTCCSISVKPESFGSVVDRWRAIVAESATATVFDLPTWQKTWWDHFGGGIEPMLLAVTADDGSLQLLAPLMQGQGEISFLGSTDLVDYHGFVCAGVQSEENIAALLREVSSDQSVRRLLFESIAENSPSLKQLPRIAGAIGWDVSVQKEDISPRMDLADEWEEYVSGLRKKDRHELRRKIRRLEAAGEVSHIELSDRDEIESSADDFFRLHRMSSPDKNEFMTADRERFFRDVSARLATEGVTRLTFLELDGKRIATSLSFVLNGTRFLYNSGYDPEFRNLAAGLLNHAYTIRKSIEQGHNVFDFMRGNEGYKYHLGGIDRDVFRIVATR